MYQSSYAEILEEAPAGRRAEEREAFRLVIGLLHEAEAKGVRSVEAAAALMSLRRLWSALLEDLATPQNDLPHDLRAALVSVGLWVMREAEAVRQRRSSSLRGLIEVNEMIGAGLR
jgi:flagellar protein FlaF